MNPLLPFGLLTSAIVRGAGKRALGDAEAPRQLSDDSVGQRDAARSGVQRRAG